MPEQSLSYDFISKNVDRRKKWTSIITHLIVLCMLFLLPDLLLTYANPRWKLTSAFSIGMYLKTAVYALAFYIEYFAVLPNSLLSRKRRRTLKFIIYNVLLLVLSIAIIYVIYHFFFMAHRHHHHHEPSHWQLFLRMLSYLMSDGAILVLTMGLSVAIRMSESWSSIEKRHDQLVSAQKAEELENLKNQLNPHFLFNTLNTIYALVTIDPEKAQQAVHQLSALLRYCLYENPSMVEMDQEINFAHSYITLMEMRIGENTTEKNLDVEGKVMVPPLIFLTLIENAYKHGKGTIADFPIQIDLKASPEAGIHLSITNHFCALDANSDNKSKGIGLANLRRRLHLIYGNSATLSTTIDGDVFTAKLTINPESDKK